ncbi:MAG: efflux RND transporter periplasmic adaptor subunit [Pseudomonadota bacterium]
MPLPRSLILSMLLLSTPAWAAPSVLSRLAPASTQTIQESLTAYGTVEYAPEHGQTVDVQGEGLLRRVFVAAGQTVHRGDPLIELENTANARLERRNAEIDVEFASKDVKRLRDLRARQLATNAEVQTAEQALAKAQAVLANIRKRLGASPVRTLRAEMDGVVEQVMLRAGEIAAPGTPLLRLAQGNRLRVRFGVEPEDIDRIRAGMPVRVQALYAGATPVTGAVREIYRQVDPKTRLAEVVVPLAGGPGLLANAMVRGEIILSQTQALTVPRSAVLYQQGRPYVFVARQGRAWQRWVRIGQDTGRVIEIRAGLRPGERVVMLGNYELQNGMALRLEGVKR